jgi:hypothetical protein|eukprot:2826681-Prymnesium_polylepis.1
MGAFCGSVDIGSLIQQPPSKRRKLTPQSPLETSVWLDDDSYLLLSRDEVAEMENDLLPTTAATRRASIHHVRPLTAIDTCGH